MRRLLIGTVVLLAVLLLADRVTAVLAARTVSAQLQRSGELREPPMVSIRGFPFLTQAFAGRYDRVDLEARDLRRRDLRLASMDITVRGAQIPLREALFGTVDAVPVESLDASGLVAFADIAQESELAQASVEPAGDQIAITARITVLGRALTVTSRSKVSLDRGSLVLTPQSVQVQGRVSKAVEEALRDRLDLRLSVGTLPYGLRLTGVSVTPEGLVLRARSGPTILQQP